MATLKEIQDAIDNKTFDPSKLSRQERNLVDEAIKRGLIKGPTTGTIIGQRQSAARDVATMDAASKNPIGVALQQQDSFFKGRNEAILAGDLIGSIYPYVADRKKYLVQLNPKYLEIKIQVCFQDQKFLIILQINLRKDYQGGLNY